MNGLGLAILSTPKGVMSDSDARKNNVGGEIICRVFNVKNWKKEYVMPKDSSIKVEGANVTVTGPKGTKVLLMIKYFHLR